MAWTVYGERFSDSDFSSTPRAYQPFTLARNLKLKAIRTWFIFYGTPSYTTLGMRIYDSKGGAPTSLKATATKTWTPATTLLTYGYGAKELYFDFTNPLWLRKDTTYHLVPWITGAALTDASHVSWMKGFPDPNTDTSEELSGANLGSVPYYMALIGAEY